MKQVVGTEMILVPLLERIQFLELSLERLAPPPPLHSSSSPCASPLTRISPLFPSGSPPFHSIPDTRRSGDANDTEEVRGKRSKDEEGKSRLPCGPRPLFSPFGEEGNRRDAQTPKDPLPERSYEARGTDGSFFSFLPSPSLSSSSSFALSFSARQENPLYASDAAPSTPPLHPLVALAVHALQHCPLACPLTIGWHWMQAASISSSSWSSDAMGPVELLPHLPWWSSSSRPKTKRRVGVSPRWAAALQSGTSTIPTPWQSFYLPSSQPTLRVLESCTVVLYARLAADMRRVLHAYEEACIQEAIRRAVHPSITSNGSGASLSSASATSFPTFPSWWPRLVHFYLDFIRRASSGPVCFSYVVPSLLHYVYNSHPRRGTAVDPTVSLPPSTTPEEGHSTRETASTPEERQYVSFYRQLQKEHERSKRPATPRGMKRSRSEEEKEDDVLPTPAPPPHSWPSVSSSSSSASLFPPEVGSERGETSLLACQHVRQIVREVRQSIVRQRRQKAKEEAVHLLHRIVTVALKGWDRSLPVAPSLSSSSSSSSLPSTTTTPIRMAPRPPFTSTSTGENSTNTAANTTPMHSGGKGPARHPSSSSSSFLLPLWWGNVPMQRIPMAERIRLAYHIFPLFQWFELHKAHQQEDLQRRGGSAGEEVEDDDEEDSSEADRSEDDEEETKTQDENATSLPSSSQTVGGASFSSSLDTPSPMTHTRSGEQNIGKPDTKRPASTPSFSSMGGKRACPVDGVQEGAGVRGGRGGISGDKVSRTVAEILLKRLVKWCGQQEQQHHHLPRPHELPSYPAFLDRNREKKRDGDAYRSDQSRSVEVEKSKKSTADDETETEAHPTKNGCPGKHVGDLVTGSTPSLMSSSALPQDEMRVVPCKENDEEKQHRHPHTVTPKRVEERPPAIRTALVASPATVQWSSPPLSAVVWGQMMAVAALMDAAIAEDPFSRRRAARTHTTTWTEGDGDDAETAAGKAIQGTRECPRKVVPSEGDPTRMSPPVVAVSTFRMLPALWKEPCFAPLLTYYHQSLDRTEEMDEDENASPHERSTRMVIGTGEEKQHETHPAKGFQGEPVVIDGTALPLSSPPPSRAAEDERRSTLPSFLSNPEKSQSPSPSSTSLDFYLMEEDGLLRCMLLAACPWPLFSY